MDIESRLEEIIEKYEIYNASARITQFLTVRSIIRSFVESVSPEKTVAVYGGGEHTYNLFSDLGKSASRISYIIDKKGKLGGRELPAEMVEPDRIRDIKPDYVILSSYTYRYEMIREVNKYDHDNNIEIVDPYELLEKRGIALTGEYYKLVCFDWEALYNKKVKMELARDDEERSAYYREIIAMYIWLRDFLSAFKWIDNMQASDREKKRYISFKNELTDFFDKIKKQIISNKHIVINWIDALMPCELDDMTYLRKMAQNGIEFKKAYTAVPVTSMAMAAMHTGKYPIEDKVLPDLFIDEENSHLINDLKKNGFDYIYCGHWHWRKMKPVHKCKKYCTAPGFVPMTLYQWETICSLANAKSSKCVMVHNVLETHVPNISGDLSMMNPVSHLNAFYDITGKSDEIGKQISISRRYVDEQLQWWASFYSNDTIKIYMSDHGKAFTRDILDLRTYNIVFIISGNNIPHIEVNRYFSNIDLSALLQRICSDMDIDKCCRDHAKIENIDTYNRNRNQRVLNDAIDNEDYNILDDLAYKIIVFDGFIYVIRVNGDEQYKTDNGNDDNYLIEKARKYANLSFIDVYKNESYRECRILYEYFNIKKSPDISYI